MKSSWKIGQVAGIGLFIHWTFLLLVGWILAVTLASGETLGAALEAVGFILAIFVCIVLHELGHALTALQFGVQTRDITLLPIGGVARLERIPEKPSQEFLVAIAGPAVNVAIAAVLAVVISLSGPFPNLTDPQVLENNFLVRLMVVNIGLVVFNMIPAFPMDGGRVLRALLSPMLGHLRATDTAAGVGQFIAVLFGMLGLFTNPLLIFIALFVYLGAQREAQMAHVHSILDGVPVRNAMMTTFRTVSAEAPLETAVQELLASDQRDFPVVENGQLVGMLRGKSVIEMSGAKDPQTQIGSVMQRDCQPVEESAMLQQVFEKMQNENCATLPVTQRGQLVGLVSLQNVGEWLMIQAGRQSGGFSDNALTLSRNRLI